MRKRWLRTGGALALVAGIAAGLFWWRGAVQVREVAIAALPARPELRDWPEELRRRVAEAERDAGSLFGAAGGLAELARLYHANGFLHEAARCYEALAWVEPGEPRWPHRHATILAGFGEVRPALVKERRALALAPAYVPARLRLADLLLKNNQPVEAVEEYQATLTIEADEPYARLGLARVAFEAERWEEARKWLEPVVEQTNFLLGYDLIVTVYERLGLPGKAAEVRSRGRASGAFRDAPDPWIDELFDRCYDPYRLGVAAGAAARAGDLDTALRWLERAVAIKPGDVSSVFQLGIVHRERKEFSSARLRFEECTRLDPDFADGWANLSALLAQLNDPAGAARVLAEGLRICPESPGLHLMRARELVRAGRRAEAMESYRRSIQYRSNEAGAFIELASLLIEAGRTAEGVAVMQQALVAEPEHPSALSALTFHAIVSGNEREARAWLERVEQQPRVSREHLERLLAAFREKFGRTF